MRETESYILTLMARYYSNLCFIMKLRDTHLFSLLQANVVGRRCGKCKSGTFGLSVDNPLGCTSCYCFRRTNQCTQADLTWSQVRHTLGEGVGARYRGRMGVAMVSVNSLLNW